MSVLSKERLTFRTYNPCDECNYSFSKQNQESGMCKLCEFKSYRELEKQGLILRLPCKVGDDLYWISDEDDEGNKKLTIKKHVNGITHITFAANRVFVSSVFDRENFPEDYDILGSRYALLTYEEAEEKLRELEGK